MRGFNPGVLNVGDIDQNEGCKKAADLAMQFKEVIMSKKNYYSQWKSKKAGNQRH